MRFFFFFSLCILLNACTTSYQITEVQDSLLSFDKDYIQQDTLIELAIQPYRESLEKSMNEVLVVAEEDLVKAKPSSNLGNLLSDALLYMTEEYTQEKVDLAIINYGGIRVPSINKGPVTLGNVFELMPFDNLLVSVKINGATLKILLDKIAAGGGWPIAGASFIIKNNEAQQVKIQGEAINESKMYHVALSDYLANGGDNLSMLIPLQQIHSNVLLRDAFIAYFKHINSKGETLPSITEQRISYE